MRDGMPRFTGTHTNRIDKKGRMATPAAFRRALGADQQGSEEDGKAMFFCSANNDLSVLDCGGPDMLKNRYDRIKDLPQDDPVAMALRYQLMADVCEVQIDCDGRIVLNPALREAAGLTLGEEVCFVGLADMFRISTVETAARLREQAMATLRADAEEAAAKKENSAEIHAPRFGQGKREGEGA